ncbi:MAG: IS110 family transposase [Bacteroidetes bacterium]|nr:IS110 family transposase [Bacteroidota bacterium]
MLSFFVQKAITPTQKGDTQMHYIGVDCHISTLEFAVVNERGTITQKAKVNTGVKEFMTFVKNVPKPRKIFIEEGELACWLLETSLNFGEQLIVTDPKINKWIGKAGQKDDAIDAEKLAQLARGKYIKEIYHPVSHRRKFKDLVFAYHDTVKSQTRIKNKIKAKFRSNGIKCNGNTVYSDKYRNQWREKLSENKITHLIVEELWVQLDQLLSSKEKFKKNMRIQSKQYPEIKKFMKIPGIGLIHAATISAIMETPHRFANKKKVWMYAGIGLMERSSGGTIYSRKLTREYNRPLKNAIKKSTEAAISSKDNQFRRQHLKLTIEKGIPSHKAKLTVARSMLAALYGMWKKGEEYDPNIDKKRKKGIKK